MKRQMSSDEKESVCWNAENLWDILIAMKSWNSMKIQEYF